MIALSNVPYRKGRLHLLNQIARFSSILKDANHNRHQRIVPATSLTIDTLSVRLPRETDDRRPMTTWERVQRFPEGVRLLWKDWLLYRNICDASRTPRNAWTKSREPHCSKTNGEYENCIPWRQREQQRRFIEALSTVLPVVLLWCIPVIGYFPMFVAIAAPRQLLSRHFHNSYEVKHYNELAFCQRSAYFTSTVHHFWNTTVLAETIRDTSLRAADSAGPLLDDVTLLYEKFVNQGNIFSVNSLSPMKLTHFTLAVGIFSSLPPKLSATIAFKVAPRWLLRRQVRQIVRTVANEDKALICMRQKMYLTGPNASFIDIVSTLSDVEVMDACLMRGLPIVGLDHVEMRLCLANHIQMIAGLKEKITKISDGKTIQENEEQIGMFSLLLPMIRNYCSQLS